MFGYQVTTEQAQVLASLHDDMRNRQPGYSFLQHHMNRHRLAPLVKDFIRHLCHSDKAKLALKQFHTTDEIVEAPIQFMDTNLSPHLVRKWLVYIRILQEKLAVLLHICSGSPGRGTEVATFNLQNTAFTPRNVYVSEGVIVLLARYSKQRKEKGSDKIIARYLDQKTSRLLTIFLVFVKPVQGFLLERVQRTEQSLHQKHMTPLFASENGRMTADRFRDVIRQQFHKGGIKFNISRYRQWTAALVRLVIADEQKEWQTVLEEMQATGHENAGHSINVADRIYGRKGNDFDGVGFKDLQRYKQWCSIWHTTLGVGNATATEQPKTEAASIKDAFKDSPHGDLVEKLGVHISEKVSQSLKRSYRELDEAPTRRGSSDHPTTPKRHRPPASPSEDWALQFSSPFRSKPATPVPLLRPSGTGNVVHQPPALRSLGSPRKLASDVVLVQPLSRPADEDCQVLLPALRKMLNDATAKAFCAFVKNDMPYIQMLINL